MRLTHVITFEGHYLIYRPLLRLAFLGNRAMADYVRAASEPGFERALGTEADQFLNRIGFWTLDPPPPQAGDPTKPPTPTTAVILMTNQCNLRCTYCYAASGALPARRMPAEIACRAVDAVARNARDRGQATFGLTFHGGGEPTLNDSVLRTVVSHARSRGAPCEISITSNGVWSEEMTEFIVANFQGVGISFDGVQEVQDVQRPMATGEGSFTRALRSITALERAGIPVSIRLTAVRESFSRLAESISFLCENTQCRRFHVEPSFTLERGAFRDPDGEQAEAFISGFREAYHEARAHGAALSYSGARPFLLTTAFCKAPERCLIVTPDGDVVTCFETFDRSHPLTPRFTIGEATEEAILVDPEAYRSFASANEARRAACSSCFCYWHCAGDCASRRAASSDDNNMRCHINRALTLEKLVTAVADSSGVWRGQAESHDCSDLCD